MVKIHDSSASGLDSQSNSRSVDIELKVISNEETPQIIQNPSQDEEISESHYSEVKDLYNWGIGWKSPLPSCQAWRYILFLFIWTVISILILVPLVKLTYYQVALVQAFINQVISMIVLNYPLELAGSGLFSIRKNKRSLIIFLSTVLVLIITKIPQFIIHSKFGAAKLSENELHTVPNPTSYASGFIVAFELFIIMLVFPLTAYPALKNNYRSKIYWIGFYVVFISVINSIFNAFNLLPIALTPLSLVGVIPAIVYLVIERKKITRNSWGYVFVFCFVQLAIYPIISTVQALSFMRDNGTSGSILLGFIFAFIIELMRTLIFHYVSNASLERTYMVSSIFMIQLFDDYFSKFLFIFQGQFKSEFFAISVFFSIRMIIRDTGLIDDTLKVLKFYIRKFFVKIRLMKEPKSTKSLRNIIQQIKLTINEQEFRYQQYFFTGLSSILIIPLILIYETVFDQSKSFCIILCDTKSISKSTIEYAILLALWLIARFISHFINKYKRIKRFEIIEEKEKQLLNQEGFDPPSLDEISEKGQDKSKQKENFLQLDSVTFWKQSYPHVLTSICYALILSFSGMAIIHSKNGVLVYT